ncbi:hypothetical protein HDG37_006447 [Paraburkholderia sp. MM5384-R2]|nr:hypothetical protein [Paraburkholderia sp. MM5384-R2]
MNNRKLDEALNPAVAQVLKRLHCPLKVILTCVRWHLAYPLSTRHLEDMMAERAVFGRSFDCAPLCHQAVASARKEFRHLKRPVGKSWRIDETYIPSRANGGIFTGPSTRTVTPSTFSTHPVSIPHRRILAQ